MCLAGVCCPLLACLTSPAASGRKKDSLKAISPAVPPTHNVPASPAVALTSTSPASGPVASALSAAASDVEPGPAPTPAPTPAPPQKSQVLAGNANTSPRASSPLEPAPASAEDLLPGGPAMTAAEDTSKADITAGAFTDYLGYFVPLAPLTCLL